MKWIQRCWQNDRKKLGMPLPVREIELATASSVMHQHASAKEEPVRKLSITDPENLESDDRHENHHSPLMFRGKPLSRNKQVKMLVGWIRAATEQKSTELILSPRRRLAIIKSQSIKQPVYSVTSPFPYAVLGLLGVMIILIFVNVVPIAGLICIFAILMIVTVVMGNHWRAKETWVEGEDSPSPEHSESTPVDVFTEAIHTIEKQNSAELASLGPPTREDEVDSLNRFFEALYASIDYNLLIIFLGLFIVIANLSDTGIPASIWNGIVGPTPFKTFGSVFDISGFVLIASQFVGNVPIIQLAKPNVEGLDDSTKRLAWAVLSFVATVGGNLTLTGSAANIIVAEKAARLDSTMAIDFFRHYHVCFWVTLMNCFVGACIISIIAIIDNATGSNW